MNKSRWIRFSGVLGAVMALFGILGGLVVGFSTETSIHLMVLAHLLIGFVLLVLWFFVSGMRNLGDAGEVIKGRSARFGVNAVFFTLVFVGILFAVNWIVGRYNKRWDLTEQGVYSLSSQAETIMKGLKKQLRIVGFKLGNPEGEEDLKDLLKLLGDANPSMVTTELIDPRSKPHLVDKYEMKAGNLMYLEYGEGEKKGVSRINETTEEALVNAVIKLTRGDAKKVYVVQGHDEPDIVGAQPADMKEFADALKDEHLSVEPILLGEKGSVPEDAAAVILATPKKNLLPQEREILIKYVEEGGRLLILADPQIGSDPEALADHFGIKINKDVVIDQVQRLFAGPSLGAQVIVRDYGAHPITQNFSARQVAIFNIASTVVAKEKSAEGITYTDLAKSGPTAWGETDLEAVFDTEEASAVKEASDTPGPVTLAIAYEKNLTPPNEKPKEGEEAKFQKTSRVVVFGDSDWILNANFALYAHRDLALNALNWLVGEDGGISIRPRSIRTPELRPITSQSYLAMLASSFLIPELILIVGLIVWWRRKTVMVTA